MIKIYAPASIGNINVGFDTLGLALSPINGSFLGDIVIIEKYHTFKIINDGLFADQLPNNFKENIIYQCWKSFSKKLGQFINLKITLKKNMPIGSGLGSSACSIVSSLLGMNLFCGKPLNKFDLLLLMGEMEGKISGSVHYDNVAPCFLGGLQLIINENKIISQNIPTFKNWFWIVAYPGIKISTVESRSILPKYFSKDDFINQNRCLAGFIHASHTNQSILAAKLMKDCIAEPYRMKLIPDFLKFKNFAKSIGILSSGISGSGPTIFAVCDNKKIIDILIKWLNKHYIKNNTGFIHVCNIDNIGARKIGISIK